MYFDLAYIVYFLNVTQFDVGNERHAAQSTE